MAFFKGFTIDFGVGTTQMGTDVGALKTRVTEAFGAVEKFIQDNLIPAFLEITHYVWPLVEEIWKEHLKPTFDDLIAIIKEELIPWIKENKEVFIAAWDAVENTVVTNLKLVALAIETTIGVITATIRLFIALLRGDWKGAWESVGEIVEEIFELITGIVRTFGVDWDLIWEGIAKDFDKRVNPIRSSLNSMITLVNNVTRKINKIPTIKIPSIPKIPSFGSSAAPSSHPNFGSTVPPESTTTVPDIIKKVAKKFFTGAFADGVRNFSGGRALVGEEGPELVDLPKGSNVTPNNQMGGSTVNINFNGPVYGVDDFNEKVNQARLAWERAGNG